MTTYIFVVEQNSDIGQLDKLLWTTLERIINIQNITPSHPVQVKLNVNIDVTPLSPWCWHSDQPSIDTLFSFPNPCPESLQGKHTDDKGLGPIITIIRAQPDKQTVTRQPVLLLGLTCHTTTVFAQLKLDCYSMRKFKVLFLLFNYSAVLHFGFSESYSTRTHYSSLKRGFLPIKLSKQNTHSPASWMPSLSVVTGDGWRVTGPGGWQTRARGAADTRGIIGGVTTLTLVTTIYSTSTIQHHSNDLM